MLIRFRKDFLLPLLFAAVVGGLSVAPGLLAVHALGSAYQGIPFFYTDNEDYYIARTQEVLDGYPRVGSPYYFEYKNRSAVQPPLSENLHALFARTVGLSLATVFVMAKAVLPALLFLLVVWFTYCLLNGETIRVRWLVSMSAGLAVTIGAGGLGPEGLLAVLRGQDIGLHLPFWTRPINPITGALLLFGCLVLLWRVWNDKRHWTALAAGILLGLSFCYFFSWGLGLSVVGWLILVAMAQKDVRRFLALSIVLGISMLMNAQSLFGFFGNADGQDLALRNGLLLMHTPLLNKTLLLALAIFFIASFAIARKGKRLKDLAREPWWIFSLALLLGGLAALNQQVLTGRAIWPYHFDQYTKPFAWIVTLVVLTRVTRGRVRRVWLVLCTLLSVFLIFQSAATSTTFHSVEADFRSRQEWAPVFSRLNRSPKDSVVLVLGADAERLAGWIPAFTPSNVYLVSQDTAGVPKERAEHKVFVAMRVEGVSPRTAHAWLEARQAFVKSLFFRDWFDLFNGREDDGWLEGIIGDLEQKYAAMDSVGLHELLTQYRLDFVLTDTLLPEAKQKEIGLPGPEPVGSYFIYRFQP